MLLYEKYIVGDLQTNCYLLWDEASKDSYIIDPGDDGQGLAELILQKQLSLKGILATHGHFDHVMAVLDLKLIFGVPFYCSQKDMFLLERQKETAKHYLKREIRVPNIKKIDFDLDKFESINLSGNIIRIIKTPGHTPGGVSFYCENEGFLFSGDTLFEDGVGSTNHSYSSAKDLRESIAKLKSLPPETILLAGH